jgi:hypothetical protein
MKVKDSVENGTAYEHPQAATKEFKELLNNNKNG